MLNRRLIRIKVFKVLFAAESCGTALLSAAEKELLLSCERTLDLYYFLLNLCPAICRLAGSKVEAGKNKFNPTEGELNASTRLADNRFAALLFGNEDFEKMCTKKGFVWDEYDVLLKKLYAAAVSSQYYQEYMSAEEDSLENDCRFFTNFFAEELEDEEMLRDMLEEKSVYWADDLGFVLNVIIKDLEQVGGGASVPRHRVFLKDDDRTFALQLLAASMGHFDEYLKLMQTNVPNWDPERIVRVDSMLVVMGIAEAVTFPSIPIKVTINEYVDISKFYSTPNSHTFVNGLLDVILHKMQESGEIVKSGRGLYTGTPKKE